MRIGKRPDKTFVGRIDKGFDFLGYHLSRQALTLANQTIQHFWEHLLKSGTRLQMEAELPTSGSQAELGNQQSSSVDRHPHADAGALFRAIRPFLV